MTITWETSLLTEHKGIKASITDNQKIILRDVLNQDKDVSENTSLFRKLLHLGYIEEIQTNKSFCYFLSHEGEVFAESIAIKKPKICKYEQPNFCHNCNGTGYIPHYAHVANGICFNCNGKGRKQLST